MSDWRKKIVDANRALRPLPSRDDIAPVRLAEPPVMVTDSDDLTVWRIPGALIVRIGYADAIGAATIEIPAHLLACLAATLAAESGDGLAERGA